MKFLSLLFILFAASTAAFAQEKDLVKIADSISNEGKTLYRSEWASWYGSDIFSAKCKARRAIAGGYISYDNGKELINVFFSKGTDPVVLSTISFGYDFDSNNYKLDTADRKFTSSEKELFTIRQTALAELNKDTLFKTYKNTSLNPVPIIKNGTKRVYILTGPSINGVVIFGNDYVIGFDKANNVASKKKLHKGIIPVLYGKTGADSSKIVLASMHTHLPEFDQFITVTDICTLMLYEKFTTWNQAIVVSKNYVSIWNCKEDRLAILTYEAWQKTNPAKNALENNSH